MITSQASRPTSTYAPSGRQTLLEVDFTTRAGQAVTITGPCAAPTLKTGTKPRPKGALHVRDTLLGLQVCEAVGMEFWAVALEPRTYWAVQDGQFFLVRNVIQRAIVTVTPVDAWGRETGLAVEFPAGRWS